MSATYYKLGNIEARCDGRMTTYTTDASIDHVHVSTVPENAEPSTREAFVWKLLKHVDRLEKLEREIDLEENNEIAAAVVIRRVNGKTLSVSTQ